jgi:hypothetical protein
MGGLGVTLVDIGKCITKGSKELPISDARVQQLFAGDEAEIQRAITGLVRAARAAKWSDDKIYTAAKTLAPQFAGKVLLGMLEGSTDPTVPYIKDLLGRSSR